MPKDSERGAGAVEYAAAVVLAGLLLGALQAIGIPAKVSAAVSNSMCTITRSCDEKNDKPAPETTIYCGRAPSCPTPSKPRPTPPIECVRAPCGTKKPFPLPTGKTTIYCGRAPCPTPPKPRPTPPIECVRAPCGTPWPRQSAS